MLCSRTFCIAAVLALLAVHVSSEGLPVQYALLPLGDLTTSDQAGPYNVPLPQAFEVEGALAAKTGGPLGPITDRDVLNFLANTECLEATFNSFAAFGAGLPEELKPGPLVGDNRKAKLSPDVQEWAEEVALDEQGHVRMIREVNGYDKSVNCPTLDIPGGFQKYFDKALKKTSNPPFSPYTNDINFLLATWSLEEIGSTGDKGCILLASNPGVSNAISGLATSASYQSGVDRHFLWQRRNETVPEYGLTVLQIVLGISNFRDEVDGAPETDQPLVNSNPNFIAVPTRNMNLVPTDIRGLTFSRTPQQVLRIVTLGAGSNDDKSKSKGGFFPEGVNGNINSTAGFQNAVNAKAGYPGNKVTVKGISAVGKAGLLNKDITKVTPAPVADQYIASGREYNITPSDGNVAFKGTPYASGPKYIKTQNAAVPRGNVAQEGAKAQRKTGGKKVEGVITKKATP